MARDIFDFDLLGGTTDDGQPIIYSEKDAITNALELWLSSSKGEYLKNPAEGGIVDTAIFKVMRHSSLEMIAFKIQNSFTLFWGGILELNKINVSPNYQDRYLEITLETTIIESEEDIAVTVFVGDVKQKLNFSYVDVEYVDANLFEFCKIKKLEQPNDRLVLNPDIESWVFGKYKFVNLTDLDPYFEDILLLLNT